MPIQAIADLERILLGELKGMREDFQQVTKEVSGLAVEVKHLVEDMKEAKGHGERIKALETDVTNLKGDLQSAATERRWIVGVLVGGVLSMIGIVVTVVIFISTHWKQS